VRSRSRSNKPNKLVITVDGPAGAGKSTVCTVLADRLGYLYLDTGAMYRAVGLLARDSGHTDPLDEALLEEICSGLDLQFVHGTCGVRLLANGRDVTEEIRAPRISSLASAVSARAVVRERLSDIQRHLGKAGGVVLEGRDMGTVVFPDADVKFFLDAAPEIRSDRRYRELRARGEQVTFAEVHQDLLRRDQNDRSRCLSPLRPATDAIILDSSNLQVEGVVQLMLEYIDRRGHLKANP
jgi:cytidylate kinase